MIRHFGYYPTEFGGHQWNGVVSTPNNVSGEWRDWTYVAGPEAGCIWQVGLFRASLLAQDENGTCFQICLFDSGQPNSITDPNARTYGETLTRNLIHDREPESLDRHIVVWVTPQGPPPFSLSLFHLF